MTTLDEAAAPAEEPRDEVDESRAPLMSHLEELRTRLIRSIAIFILVFVAAFFVSDRLYQIMDLEPERLGEGQRAPFRGVKAAVELQGVTFRYGCRGDVLYHTAA